MEKLDIREFLDYEDLIRLQLLVSCKINRLEHELDYYYFFRNDNYSDIKLQKNYYERLYRDIESILLNY